MKIIASIYDAKAEVWSTPMFFDAPGQAVRSFSDAVNDKSTEFGRHPEDFTLFELGTFDERAGKLVNGIVESLALGINLIVESDEQ